MDTVYLDLETTGLYDDDEIVQIAIIDDDGETLLASLCRPVNHEAWYQAEQIHGIAPADVAEAPALDELRPAIIEAVTGKRVVIYNVSFERQFLREELRRARICECAMEAFAEEYGDFNEYHGSYTWQTLSTAADHVRFEWPGEAHDATADCLATRAVWHWLTKPEEQERVQQIKDDEYAINRARYYIQREEWESRDWWERYRREISDFWMVWWDFPLWRDGKKQVGVTYHLDNTILDELHLVFTGYKREVWDAMQRTPDLPIYRAKAEIPETLMRRDKIKDVPAWVKRKMKASAMYVSLSGKTFWYLFDPSQATEIEANEMPHYKSGEPWGPNLATFTRLTRQHKVPVAKARELEVVAKYFSLWHKRWLNLYTIPEEYRQMEVEHA